jgi:uncharacterized OB-fold protein
MGEEDDGLRRFNVKCKKCGNTIDSFVPAEQLNKGTESCTECGSSDNFENIEVE